MKVKISVKKLYEMEQIIAALKDGQKRYREQIGDMFNANEDRKEQLINQAETINYLTDENDALKRKNKYMNQVIGKLMDKIPKETLSPEEKQWCDLEEQLWKDREEFMKDEDPMDG